MLTMRTRNRRHANPTGIRIAGWAALAVLQGICVLGVLAQDTAPTETGKASAASTKHAGGEPESIVQVANLVYAGSKSSQCFSDHFLVQAQKDSTISTSRRFHAVKLSSDELFEFPLIIMTGEGVFQLTDLERENLKRCLERGGFLLASASCSSSDWDRSFRREMSAAFPDRSMNQLGMDHPVFHTVYDITELSARHGQPRPLEGISFARRLGVLYSRDGLNDTARTRRAAAAAGATN